MSLTQADFVERVFATLPGAAPEIRDLINDVSTECLLGLGEAVADSPVKHLLTMDFVVNSVGGSCNLNTALPAGGGTLASNNVYALLFDTIPKGNASHPDSAEPLQIFRAGTQWLGKPSPYSSRQHIRGVLSANQLVLRWDDSSTPSDQIVTFKASFAPTFGFFNTVSADIGKLEADLVGLGATLLGLRLQAGAPQG